MEEINEIAIDIDPLGSMRGEFEDLSDPSPWRCIYKVPKRLREGNEKAYTPQVVSIGPLHHEDKHLKAMEEHKMRYVRDLLLRNKVSWERCFKIVEDKEEELRSCYAEHIELPPDEFVKLVLVDALFLIEFLLRHNSEYLQSKNDYIFGSPWMKNDIWSDLVMLENQLPFFILEYLWEGEAKISHPILGHVYDSFRNLIYSQGEEYYPSGRVEHFVDVIRNLCLPKEIKTRGEPESSTAQPHQAGVKFEVNRFVDFIRNLCLPKETKSRGKLKSIPSLTQLHRAGVKFEERSTQNLPHQAGVKFEEGSTHNVLHQAGVKFEESSTHNLLQTEERSTHNLPHQAEESLLDIHFANGVLEIPKFQIDDTTEITIRNLVAYEQCHYLEKKGQKEGHDLEKAYICDYVVLMDGLVNAREDVELLQKYEILNNMLGTSNQVSTLINNLGKGLVESDNFYYETIRDHLNEYCKKSWPKWKANLKQKYFNSPWAAISVGAATLLLMLAITQTVLSIISIV